MYASRYFARLMLVVAAIALAMLGLPAEAHPTAEGPRPPTDEPGWVWVGDATNITLPTGAVVSLPDQKGVPAEQRIAWVRAASPLGRGDSTPPDPAIAEPLYIPPPPGTQQYWDYDSETTSFCNIWSYCAYVTDSSYVGYTKPSSTTVDIFVCYAKTRRTWNNPYGLPQMSYDKVKSFVYEFGAWWGDYEPDSGTARANYWYEVSSCWTASHAESFSVKYGSKWDSFPGSSETSPRNRVPGTY